MTERDPAPPLRLTLSTPQAVLHQALPIRTLRAFDASGSFGIHAGHEDLLTVLGPGVLQWQAADGRECWCAIDDAVLRVQDGTTVEIAAREAIEGQGAQSLTAQVVLQRQRELEARRAAQSSETRMQAQAVRKLAAWLMTASGGRSAP